MDILHLIDADHQKVAELFQQLHHARGNAQNRRRLFAELKEELALHTQAEEQVFYPALQESDEARDMVHNAQEEHRLVAEVLEDMALDVDSGAEWDEKLSELQENVEGHVEEEENELFEIAHQLFSTKQASQLAADWRRVKAEQQMAKTSQ
jgi:iron-sulfur cluster repair protein YtfE (RIC family)